MMPVISKVKISLNGAPLCLKTFKSMMFANIVISKCGGYKTCSLFQFRLSMSGIENSHAYVSEKEMNKL